MMNIAVQEYSDDIENITTNSTSDIAVNCLENIPDISKIGLQGVAMVRNNCSY